MVFTLVIFLLIIGWGIYRLDWQGAFVSGVVKIVPFPAARVDETAISFSDYLRSLKTAESFFARQKASGLLNDPSLNDIKKFVIDRQIESVLVKKLAQKYGQKVSSSEVNDKITSLLSSYGSADEFSQFLQDYYGLDISNYSKIFTEPDLLYAKVSQAVIADQKLNKQATDKINQAQEQLKNGKSFEDVAKEFSEGKNPDQGGLIGNFSRGDLPKDIEDALFDLADGSYGQPVILEDAWQILKVEKKDLQTGVLTLKTILVKVVTVDDLIKDLKSKAVIKSYVY